MRLHARVGTAWFVGVGYVVLFLCWIATGWGGPARRTLIGDLFFAPTFLATAWMAWRVSAREALATVTRRGWRRLAVAYALLWLANMLWTATDLVAPNRTVVLAGRFLVLLSYIPLLAGLLSFPSAPRRLTSRVSLGLDITTVALGVGLVLWELVVRPRIGVPVTDVLSYTMTVAVPVADLAVVAALTALLLRRADAGSRAALLLLAAGHVVSVAGGVVFAVLVRQGPVAPGGWVDALWMVSDALMFSAAAVQARAVVGGANDTVHRASRFGTDRQRFLPMIGVGLGLALLVAVTRDVWRTPVGVVVFGSVAITVLVLVRQLVALGDHRRAESALAESEERYRALVDDLHEVVFRTDASGRWTFLNRAWTEITGLEPCDSIGHVYLDHVHPDDRAACIDALRPLALGSHDECRHEARYVTGHAGVRWVEWHARAERDAAGTLVGTSGTLTDVTSRRALEEQLRHQAFHDPLTELANRALFHERVERALARAERSGDGVAVLFLDLDGFKAVNDTLGHLAGDRLLIDVAQRLLAATRGSDTVARYGGDEFAILLENPHGTSAPAVVAGRVLAALATPFLVGGVPVVSGASVGIAEALDGYDVEELVRQADAAMYQAKRDGKGRYAVYASGPSAASALVPR